jgi:hypothetical protein
MRNYNALYGRIRAIVYAVTVGGVVIYFAVRFLLHGSAR